MIKKKIIITGALGFVGYELSHYFSNRYDVIGIDNQSTNTEEYYNTKDTSIFSELLIQSMEEVDVKRFNHIHYIIHCAARARIQPSINNAYLYMKDNLQSTKTFVSWVDYLNCKGLFISSSSVKGIYEKSPYTESKEIGEEMCSRVHSISIVRLFNVFGDNMPTKGDNTTLVGVLLDTMANGGILSVYGNRKRDYTYVGDVCRGIMIIMRSEKGLYELGGGNPISTMEVVGAAGVRHYIREARDYEAEVTSAINNIEGWSTTVGVIRFLQDKRNHG